MIAIPNVPAGAAELVTDLLAAVFKAVRATSQEEIDDAAMSAAEAAKRYADKKKFGSG